MRHLKLAPLDKSYWMKPAGHKTLYKKIGQLIRMIELRNEQIRELVSLIENTKSLKKSLKIREEEILELRRQLLNKCLISVGSGGE